MENREISRTLEEGFVESKLGQNDKILEEEELDSVSLFNLSEKVAFDVYGGYNEVRHLDLARKFGNGSMEESSLCDGYPDDDKLLVVTSDERRDGKVQDLEEGLKYSGNVGIPVAKRDDVLHSSELFPMEKEDDVLHSHERGSPTKIEVSGSGINLFVEVFGPLDGGCDGNNNVNDKEELELGESDLNQEFSLEENGTVFKNVSDKNEGEDIVGEQEFTFDVGDLVWVKTRTQLWWPGMISDPANAPTDATKSGKRGSYLVKYFGSANFVWFENSDLKPFLESFEQMSGQNNSRNFFGSVEKALSEIGQRVKTMMTCPCFSKDSQALAVQRSCENKKDSSMSMEETSKLDVLSLSKFEPASFVARLRHLARSVSVPGKIELTLMKSRLSAFYCSSGHLDLPLQMLIEEGHNSTSGGGKNSSKARDADRTISTREKRNHVDDGDLVLGDKMASSGKGSESRERKKSKYLSYPYIDVNQGLKEASTLGQEMERSGQSTKSTPPGSCSSTNSRKKGSKKPLKVHNMVCKATDDINACSSELLAELRSMAHDCFYLSRSKYSDSLMRFYGSFRIFAFLNADVACKDAGVLPASDLEQRHPENSAEAAVQMEGTRVEKESKNGKVNLSSIENAEGSKSSKTDDLQGKGNVTHKKAKKKKKKERVISATPDSTNNSFNAGTNIFPNNTFVISFQQPPPGVPNNITSPKIVENATTPGLPQIVSIAKLSGLNGANSSNAKNPSFSVDHVPVGGLSTTLGTSLPEQTKEQLVSPNIVGANQMATVPSLMVQNITQFNNGVNSANQYWNGGFATRELGSNMMINTGLGSFVQQSLQNGLFTTAAKPQRRKRKRKEKTPSAIPDLNGNVPDTNSSGNSLPDGNPILSPVGETQQKEKNKSVDTESGSNTKTSRVSTVPEPIGGTLILNFAPESTVPSKETLVATFSRFGLLKESEIQVSEDSSVRIPYERISEARFAYRSLEKNNPFGALLASFKLDCEPAALRIKEKKKNFQSPRTFVPADASKTTAKNRASVDASKTPAKSRETPDIAFMKQNVEMMKMTLEKVGNNLSAEMRTKLENEIKVFLDKISSVAGGSSST